jgi:surface antigen
MRTISALLTTMIVVLVPAATTPFGRQAASPQQSRADQPVRVYKSAEFDLTLPHPAGWTVEERRGRQETTRQLPERGERNTPLRTSASIESDDTEVMKYQVLMNRPSGVPVIVTVFSKSVGLEGGVNAIDPAAFERGALAASQPNAVVNGFDGYIWRTGERSQMTGALVFMGDKYLYQVTFPIESAEQGEVREFLLGMSVGADKRPTRLPDVREPGVPTEDLSGEQLIQPASMTCSNCGETDTYANSYSCCSAPYGNCTWKTEERRAGDNNFIFTGSGRDAYKWMSLAWSNTSYGAGGTMPQVGAVLVASKLYGTVGHVATVTSIGSNGSVTVVEQNCSLSCTRTKTYDATWLRTNKAGYIYKGSAPTPTARNIAASGETIIDDFNFSGTYNFSTFGPGSPMSFNDSYRSWGSSSSGLNSFMHYVTSRSSSSTALNFGRWRANIQTAGVYELQAWIPNSTKAGATSLKYDVNGTFSVAIDQTATRGTWVRLKKPGTSTGYWSFQTGLHSVYLADTYAGTSGQSIAFDALRFIRR